MGLLRDGKWVNQWYNTKTIGGLFERKKSQFRNWITADGSPASSGKGDFISAIGRYHLYISLACLWASRALTLRSLKNLADTISFLGVHWYMTENAWTFQSGERESPDTVNKTKYLYGVYAKAKKNYSGRVVPLEPELNYNQSHNRKKTGLKLGL